MLLTQGFGVQDFDGKPIYQKQKNDFNFRMLGLGQGDSSKEVRTAFSMINDSVGSFCLDVPYLDHHVATLCKISERDPKCFDGVIKAIIRQGTTQEDELKLYYEGSFPGPKELYVSLKNTFEHFHPDWDEKIDYRNLKEIHAIVEGYHKERKISSAECSQDRIEFYFEEFFERLLRGFSEHLLAFPIPLGDVLSQHMPDFKSESVSESWSGVAAWAGKVLSSATQMAMYHYHPPNSRDISNGIRWEEIEWNGVINRTIQQRVLDIPQSIINQKRSDELEKR